MKTISREDEETTFRQGYTDTIAGCFTLKQAYNYGILMVTGTQWPHGHHFFFLPVSDKFPTVLRVTVPRIRLEQVMRIYGYDVKSYPAVETRIRRCTIVHSKKSEICNIKARCTNLSFLHVPRDNERRMALAHWENVYNDTEGQLFQKLADFRMQKERISNEQPRNPSLASDIIVCVPIPWEMYRLWATGQVSNRALDILWCEGIVTTIPVNVGELQRQSRIWCPDQFKLIEEEGDDYDVLSMLQEARAPVSSMPS